jgi:hypothetical protein
MECGIADIRKFPLVLCILSFRKILSKFSSQPSSSLQNQMPQKLMLKVICPSIVGPAEQIITCLIGTHVPLHGLLLDLL